MLNSNTWNHLTVWKQIISNNRFNNKAINKLFAHKYADICVGF